MYVRVCMHACMHVCMYVYVCMYMCMCMCMCMCISLCMCMCMCMCMYVCKYIYIYTYLSVCCVLQRELLEKKSGSRSQQPKDIDNSLDRTATLDPVKTTVFPVKIFLGNPLTPTKSW